MAYQGIKVSGAADNTVGVNYLGKGTGTSGQHGSRIYTLDELAGGGAEPVDGGTANIGSRRSVFVVYDDTKKKAVVYAALQKARDFMRQYMTNNPAPPVSSSTTTDYKLITTEDSTDDLGGINSHTEISRLNTTSARFAGVVEYTNSAAFSPGGDVCVFFDALQPLWSLDQQFERLLHAFIKLTYAVA